MSRRHSARRIVRLFPFIAAFAVVTCHRPSPTPAESWGPAIDGVQMRVLKLPTDAHPTSITLPHVGVQIRNRGGEPITFRYLDLVGAGVEIDGAWYGLVGAGSGNGATMVTVLPGDDSRIVPLPVDTPFESIDAGARVSPSGWLDLEPGAHVIRARTSPAGRDGATGVSFVSNALSIDLADVPRSVERHALIEAGSLGDVRALERLHEKYPDALLSTLKVATGSEDRDVDSGNLLHVLYDVRGDDVDAFLRSKLGRPADFSTRSVAARILFERGDPLALPAALATWRAMQPAFSQRPSDFDDSSIRLEDAARETIGLLAGSAEPRAIAALQQALPATPLGVRLTIVAAFLPPSKTDWDLSDSRVRLHPGLSGELTTLPSGQVGAAIERLLRLALQDRTPDVGVNGHIDAVSVVDPRVCDFAALTLARRWPQTYSFTWPENVPARDREIAAMRAHVLGTASSSN